MNWPPKLPLFKITTSHWTYLGWEAEHCCWRSNGICKPALDVMGEGSVCACLPFCIRHLLFSLIFWPVVQQNLDIVIGTSNHPGRGGERSGCGGDGASPLGELGVLPGLSVGGTRQMLTHSPLNGGVKVGDKLRIPHPTPSTDSSHF